MQQTQNELKTCHKKQQDWEKEEERREGIHVAIMLALVHLMVIVCSTGELLKRRQENESLQSKLAAVSAL